jgi:aminoglycoside phosphotransferase (APT) family kinase protein
MSEDLAAHLLRVLRTLTDTPTLDYDAPPQPLTGGFWAELLAFRLVDAPDRLSGDLVARVMPDPVIARKETVLQAETAAQGYPTPAVRLSGGPDAGLGRAFMVMDRAAGTPLLAGLDGVGTISKLPHLLRHIPAVLAKAMVDLHHLDPAPVRARLDVNGDTPATVRATLERIRTAARLYDRDDLVRAVDWLVAHPPPPSPDVICHGDLHPFNLLVDDAGTVTVLDWSAGLIGPAAYDAAFTSLLLGEPPIAVPRPARPLIRAAGRLLSRRFLRDYRAASGTGLDAGSLRWHQSLVCLRALVEVAAWTAAGDIDAKTSHPWLVCGPAFASRLGTLTGVPVRPR